MKGHEDRRKILTHSWRGRRLGGIAERESSNWGWVSSDRNAADGGPTALPAPPPSAPANYEEVRDKEFAAEQGKEHRAKRKEVPTLSAIHFCEFFAGKGSLTSAVHDLGMNTDPPDDVQTGGTNFLDKGQVERLKNRLRDRAQASRHLVVHLAPPCATFSRARDRSFRTKIRSTTFPQGLPSCKDKCRKANLIAKRAFELAAWAADELGALVSVENPAKSYLWLLADKFKMAETQYVDVDLDACMFGATYKKPTKLRCWNWEPSKLRKTCSAQEGVYACGRSVAQGHEVLEFGGKSTADAAAYVEGLCAQWALAIADATSTDISRGRPLDEVELAQEGRVKRHRARGEDEATTKERRAQEDSESCAGMRNPADLERKWPRLWETMDKVKQVLLQARRKHPELVGLAKHCGEEVANPVEEHILQEVRLEVAEVLGVASDQADWHHQASPWRPFLVKGVQVEADDPDKALGDWLVEGAPMGIAKSIEPGGLFPQVAPEADLSLEELDCLERYTSNHPSFSERHGEDKAPGMKVVEGYLAAGHGELFQNAQEAAKAFNKEVHPAPMGNITKMAHGSLKHRVIQDLRRNRVNDAVRLPERQVLPRGVDHAVDMAKLTENSKTSFLSVLVLDSKDALMSIPLAEEERPYNCSVVPEGVRRGREPLHPTEPEEGQCIVWRVLGFGGKPNPLVYSRAASFAMRTAQAMYSADRRGSEASMRSQLYVDDPAICVYGSPSERSTALDIVLLWWMTLGIPLAWKKGKLVEGADRHEWIGVAYQLKRPGMVTMTLPTEYLETVLQTLEPFCTAEGRASYRDAERMVGKAGRIAQVVPGARPFLAGLYAALAATRRDIENGKNKTKGSRIATSRFGTSARWLRALIKGDADTLLPLERKVFARKPAPASTAEWVIQFDACTSGGGAVLRCNQTITEFFYGQWKPYMVEGLDVEVKQSKHQTFWEFLALLLSMVIWGHYFKSQAVAVVGDNIGALTHALNLKAKGTLAAIARELTWRKERLAWAFEVGHIPSELNVVADALSRQFEAVPPRWPTQALSEAKEAALPNFRTLWRTLAR